MLLGAATMSEGTQYGQRIVHPNLNQLTSPDNLLKDTIPDARRILSIMTGNTFTSVVGNATASSGIVLATTNSPGVPAELISAVSSLNSPEAYVIKEITNTKLLIVSPTALGLSHGLYGYLQHLGARWYMPGARWEVIPQRTDLTLLEPLQARPFFRGRHAFGSQAFGPTNPVDTNKAAQADFDAFLRRNRFKGSLNSYAHDWQHFAERNITNFLNNPAFYCGVLTNAQGKVRPGLKLCVNNPDLLDLYAADRLAYWNKFPNLLTASVVPSDGGGFCTNWPCASGSPSAQAFHLANEVARRVATNRPGKLLGTYAYDVYAAPPDFAIETNVHVTVFGSVFQKTRWSPRELLCEWVNKMNGERVGVGDYWLLPQAFLDVPEMEIPTLSRINDWRAQGADLFLIETTAGGGPLGPGGLCLAGQAAWSDFADDANTFVGQAFIDLFGHGSPILEIEGPFILASHALGYVYQKMDEALQYHATNGTEAQRQRVYDLANYLHYLRLIYEFRTLPTGPARCAKAREILKWVWRTHNSRLVHSFAVHVEIQTAFAAANCPNDFTYTNFNASGWVEVLNEGPVTPAETQAVVANGLALYGPTAYPLLPYRYDDRLVPLFPEARPNYPELTFTTTGYTRFQVYVPPGVTGLVVRAKNASDTTTNPVRRVRMKWGLYPISDDCNNPAPIDVMLTDTMTDYYLPMVEGTHGFHELAFLNMAGHRFTVQLPNVPLAATRMTPGGTMRLYFYVPSFIERIILRTGTHNPKGVNLVSPLNQAVPVTFEKVGNRPVYSANVPVDQHGIWALTNYLNRGVLQFYSTPQAVSFHPDGVMVPVGMPE